MIATAIYLDPLNLEAWQTLSSYTVLTSLYIDGGISSASAEGSVLADYQSPASDTLKALGAYKDALGVRGARPNGVVNELLPLGAPAVRELWGWVFERG